MRRAQSRRCRSLHKLTWRGTEALPYSRAAEAVHCTLVLSRRAAVHASAQQQGACAAGAHS